jgi:hypothetical protein
MKQKEENFDRILKSKLENFTVKGNPGLKIRFFWMLNRKKFVFLASGVLALSMICYLFIFHSNDETTPNNLQATNHTQTSNKTLTKHEIEAKSELNINTEGKINPDENTDFTKSQSEINTPILYEKETSFAKSSDVVKCVHPVYALSRIETIQIPNFTSGPDSLSRRFFKKSTEDYYVLPENRTNKYSLTLAAGPVFSIDKVPSNNYNNESLSYVSSYKNPGYRIDLGFEMRIKNFLLITGLGYTFQNQTLSFYDQNLILDPDKGYYAKDTIWAYIYNPPVIGKPVVLGIDSAWVDGFRTKTDTYIAKNKLHYFRIPVSIAYQLKSNNFTYQPFIGISINYLSGSSITVPVRKNENIVYLKSPENHLQRITTKVHFGLGISYDFNAKSSIFINSSFEQNLNAVFVGLPINNENKMISVLFGYKFAL